jgi:hypothetical protein
LKEFDYTYSDGFVPSERDVAGAKPAAQARIEFYYSVYVEARISVWGGGGWGGAIECEGHIVKECWSRGDVASPLLSAGRIQVE